MELRERLRTPIADAIRKAEREAKLAEQKAEQAEQKGKREERNHLLELLNQNYTVEQLKEILTRESQQAAATSR
jgi:hypothetical protein